MASHSRPSRSRGSSPRITVSRTVSRTAFTLALASAASVPFLGGAAQAQPRMTPAEVRAKVAELYRDAEQATQDYDGAKQRADDASAAVSRIQDELARRTDRLNAARDALGTVAAAQYRSGSLDPALQLALSSTPQDYLEQAGMLHQLGARQASALAELIVQQRDVAVTRDRAAGTLKSLRSAQAQLAAHKHAVETKLGQAQALLAELTPADRAAANAADTAAPTASPALPSASRTTPRLPLGAGPAPSARAARAVAFAYQALGLPYVWGATGPNAYDCSGLTQAAWQAAGVSLPRTTYTQINAGTPSRSPNSAPATWCSSTPVSPTSASTSEAAG